MPDPDVTEDALLGGAVRLLQMRRGHRAGTDAVLLAGLCKARPGDRVVDLGAASGAVGLMVAARVGLGHVTFIDRDAALVALCVRNAGLNGLEGRFAAIVADALARPLAGLPEVGPADLVVTNPPYFDEASPPSPDPGRRSAHRMDVGGLPVWLGFAAARLRNRGRLALIHRSDALAACLDALRPAFGSFEIVPIYPRLGQSAHRVIVRAVKGARSPMRIEPGLVLHGPDGMTAESEAIHARPSPDHSPVLTAAEQVTRSASP